MSETQSHRRAKAKAAGPGGRTEVPISGGRSLDALSANKKRATEVERSGTQEGLKKAARRLSASGAPQRVLQVPQKDMDKAAEAMKSVGVAGTVKNIGDTQRRSIRSRKSSGT